MPNIRYHLNCKLKDTNLNILEQKNFATDWILQSSHLQVSSAFGRLPAALAKPYFLLLQQLLSAVQPQQLLLQPQFYPSQMQSVGRAASSQGQSVGRAAFSCELHIRLGKAV